MYDENQIEDSLEFIRQIKDFYPDESGTGSNKKEELTVKELFENMASAMQDIGGKKPWESVLSEIQGGQKNITGAGEAAPYVGMHSSVNKVRPAVSGTDLKGAVSDVGMHSSASKVRPAVPDAELKGADTGLQAKQEQAAPKDRQKQSDKPKQANGIIKQESAVRSAGKAVQMEKTDNVADVQPKTGIMHGEGNAKENGVMDFDIPEMSSTTSGAALKLALEELKQIKENQENAKKSGIAKSGMPETAVSKSGTFISDISEQDIPMEVGAFGQTAATSRSAVSEEMGFRHEISAADAKKALGVRREKIEAGKTSEDAPEVSGDVREVTEEKKSMTSDEIDEIFEKELKKNRKFEADFFRRSGREKIKGSNISVPKKSFIENLKEQKEDFMYKLANRKSANEMLATDAEGNKRVLSNRNSFKWVSNALIVFMCIFIAFSLASLVTNYVAHQTTVEGESMSPALSNEDSLIIQKVSYYFGDPERYDVVVFPVAYDTETREQTYFVKRVIGLPNETVQIMEGKVYIDGQMLPDDSYSTEDILDPGLAAQPLTLGKDEYFVLGDNRNTSTDSRSSYVGMVSRNNIVGKAWFCIWPLTHIGGVK